MPRVPGPPSAELVFEISVRSRQCSYPPREAPFIEMLPLSKDENSVPRAPQGLSPFALKTPGWARHCYFQGPEAESQRNSLMGFEPKRSCSVSSVPCHLSPPAWSGGFLGPSMGWFHQCSPMFTLPKSPCHVRFHSHRFQGSARGNHWRPLCCLPPPSFSRGTL